MDEVERTDSGESPQVGSETAQDTRRETDGGTQVSDAKPSTPPTAPSAPSDDAGRGGQEKFSHLPNVGNLTVRSTYKDIIGPSFYRVWNDFLTFKYSTYVLDGGRGCVDGNTMIDTPKGQVKIRDFKGGVVYAYDGFRVVYAYACKPIRYMPKPLFKVTMDNGAEVTCTAAHRFLTDKGWKRTEELRKGTLVAIPEGDVTTREYAERHCFASDAKRRIARMYCVANRMCPVDAHKMDASETYEDALKRVIATEGVSEADKSEARKLLNEKDVFYRYEISRKIADTTASDMHRSMYYTSVKSVDYDGVREYYDMFVPFFHNYVANGIIHHNSLKSSAISIFIMCGLERDRKEALRRKKMGDKRWRHYLTHCVCYRKVFGTCEQSVYSQLEWAIDKLNLGGKWILKKSPLKIVRVDTGQMILFRGLDDPLKSKSLKAPFSFFRYLWFEEAAEFDGIAEIRNVSQSIHRGGFDFQTFFSYNPPETSACWINKEMTKLEAADATLKRYHSDYRTVPRTWLGEQFFAEAEVLKRANYRAWRHEYLGEITGNGGTVFPNVVAREVTDEEIRHFSNLHWGCDFGTVDPTVLIGMEFDRYNYRLIIFAEVYESNMMLDRMEKLFKETHFGYEYIRADCAAKQMIMELDARGLPMLRAEKGPDSIMHGVKWLQNLREIVIDPKRCPHTYDEFSVYEYEKSKLTGEFTAKLPDHNNHAIDACRYAVEDLSGNGGVF